MSDFYDQLEVEYTSDTHRKAYRVSIPNLKVIIKDISKEFQALDISAGGVAFSLPQEMAPSLKEGQEIELSLVIRTKVFLEDLKAVLVKVKDDFAACEFREMPLRQEARLDKLVLEVQKKMIALQRKKQKEEADETK